MKRTKLRIMKKTPQRALIISNVLSYHSHLRGVCENWPDRTLLSFCHPADRDHLADGVGILFFKPIKYSRYAY
jgi:hypothetical protein